MKKLLLLLVAILTSINLVKAQCDLNFDYVNTGSNMTAFFTPPAASAIHAELGDGTIGSFYTDADGSLICAASAAFNGAQIQLAVMADDSTSPDKDGFSSGESINWFYQTADGSIFSISPSPNENFTINGISFIQSSSISAIDCGGDDTTSDDECPPLDFNFLNTGSNMTLFVTSGDLLSDLGNGTVGVYFTDDNGDQICGGSASYTGGQVQIAANGDDATTTEKDGFSAGEAIVWKFEANDGSQYNLTPTPQDGFTLNATSFVFGMSYEAISCAVDVEGCTDELYIEYNPNATIDDGSCSIIAVYGCTDSDYVEYNSNANVDDGSCSTLIVSGCTNSNATNYDSNANTSDGSCEYDLIGVGCQVNFEYTNTGTNQTVFITPNATIGTPLSSGDQIGVFYISSTGEAISAGSSIWNGGQLQITAFGDDATTDDIDGLLVDAPLLLMAQSGDDVYIVTASYQTPNMSTYTTNGISFITGLEFELACTVEYLGCTDSSACNYDSTANTNDNSCVYPGDIYDCEGGCINDADGDLVCDEFEVIGCQDESASNYDASATDAGECVSWEDAYESCLESGGDDGISQEDVDAAFENGVASVDITSDNQAIADEAYGWGYGDGYSAGAASVTPEDGVSQSDVDAAVAEVQANAASQIAALEAEIENLLENSGDDGITQIDVDNAYLIGYSDGAASIIPEDGIGQDDVDAAYADGVASVVCDPNAGYDIGYSDGAASVTPEDGIGQADVDAAYADGVASVDITSDNSTIADESYLFGYNDGVASAQADLDALQVLLDEAIANSGEGSCEPIYIDLLEGWNIMGYTLPNPQDVTATLASIVSNVQIVKNNSAAVYWPEYSFNGIGDFIPGQGYQIRMINALDNYTFPDGGSQRIELSPSVPEWVHELPVLNHPNDIRSLVRVVNMLGQ